MLYNPFVPFVNLITLFMFIIAFVLTETKVRLYLVGAMVLLFILPLLITIPILYWVFFIGKVIFSIWCIVYLKMHGYLTL